MEHSHRHRNSHHRDYRKKPSSSSSPNNKVGGSSHSGSSSQTMRSSNVRGMKERFETTRGIDTTSSYPTMPPPISPPLHQREKWSPATHQKSSRLYPQHKNPQSPTSNNTTSSLRETSEYRAARSSSIACSQPSNRRASESEHFFDEEVPTSASSSSFAFKNSLKNKTNEKEEHVPLTKINVNSSSSKAPQASRSARLMRIGLGSLMGVAATGVGIYSVSQLAPRRSEISDLEAQVNRLKAEVDQLESENARFNASNDQLNASIAFLDQENIELNATHGRLEASILLLQGQIPALQDLVNGNLSVVVNNLRQELNDLNQTIVLPLQQRAQELNATVRSLILDNTNLHVLEDNLQSNITSLKQQNIQLTITQNQLNHVVVPGLKDETVQLEQRLTQLQQATDVLGQTSQALTPAMEQAAADLSARVAHVRNLHLRQSMVYAYDAFYASWDCTISPLYRGLFRNQDAIIGNVVNSMMDDIMFELQDPVCLNRNDVELYLDGHYNLDTGMSVKELREGLDIYVPAALEYYYGTGPNSLTMHQWEEADFSCSNLGANRFVYTK